MRKLEKIRAKNEEVKVFVGDEDTQTSFLISLNQFLDLGLRENMEVSDELFDSLKSAHSWYYAFSRALRRLSASDQSESEIRELLDKVDGLTDKQADDIISHLRDYGYIDDESIVRSFFENDHQRLVGKRKTAHNLSQRGIDRQLIDNLSHLADERSQIDACFRKAQNLIKKTHGLSKRQAMAKVRDGLYAAGFENDIIDTVIAQSDFERDETDDIVKAYELAYKRYSRSAKDRRSLRQKVYQYLYNKGFESYNITEVMNRMENSDED
ncbi:MAG: RecX family transcriptional regulator [Erysipelotrichaceae bacterium]|nr:RecX family transcriptional regulator [Erysipelotrichaceae bacterium]